MVNPERIMAEATPAETGTASNSVNPEVSSPKSAESTNTQQGSTLGVYSPDFDPNRTDYQAKQEGHFYVYIDPKTGKEVARVPRISGGALPVWLEPASLTFSKSFKDYEQTLKDYTEINAVNRQAIPNQHRFDFHILYEARLRELVRTQTAVDRLVNNAEDSGLLHFVINDLKILYGRATQRAERSYFRAESGTDWRTELRDIAEGNYKETFWHYGDDVLREKFGNVDIKVLREQYEGLGAYVASKVAIALEKDLKQVTLSPGTELGDRILVDIKREQGRVEARRRARATADEILEYNDWRERFDFSWAQNRGELRASVFAWLEKFVAHLPEATIDELNSEANTWKRNAISALEKAANRLQISEKEPFYKELKSTIEAYVGVLGGVKFLETEGGFEAFTIYLEEFAHNFNDKHDAIYLGNAKSAIIQAFLARNHGAISMGAPGTIEKPQAGDLADFRGNIEEQAKLYAATHELYIKPEDFERRMKESNGGYGWDDIIEKLLLSGGDRDQAIAARDIQALMRMDIRSQVFQRIKERLDKEDEARDGRSFAELSDDERKEEVRFRIRAKMFLAGFRSLAEDIDATIDLAEKDRKLWDWLRGYNDKREKQGHSLFFPSNWDTVRLSINTPAKLVDRALSEDELDAMIEEVGAFRIRIEATGQIVELDIDDLTDDEIRAKVDALPNLDEVQKKELLEDALFDKQQRETEAERAFNINRAYQKFLAVDARWGGMAVRVLNQDGAIVLRNVWEIAEEILKAKIDQEAADIEVQVTAHETALRARGTLTDAQIEEAIIKRRRLLRRNSTFGATLALREIGIANDLPIWNYYYYNDPQRIQTFAPLVGYTHNDKVELVDLLDRGRREMRAVWDYLADTYMDGRVLIVLDEPNAGVDENGQPIAFHQERWDRGRVINEAGVPALREVIESRFMLSTSGGIEVVDLISKIADLGIYDLLWEMGCQDFREFQGFIKRRDEWELKRQSFWNIREWRDPITYAKRLRGAGAALPYLRGGEVKGQGRKPGVLIEPQMGAYKVRDFVLEEENWIAGNRIVEVEKLIRDAIPKLKKEAQDRMVEIGVGILVTLIEYMDSLRYKMNRAGLAPKNWKADNDLILDAYLKELLKRSPILDEAGKILEQHGAETLGSKDLGYAPQGRSELAVAFYKEILKTSTYHILVERDRTVWAKRGKEAKARMDAKRAEIVARGIPPEVQARINARRGKLVALHTSPARINEEVERLENQYYDERLHSEFYGEWPARFADIAD